MPLHRILRTLHCGALAALLFFLTLPSCSVASAATIILVRHAERASAMTADALLSPAGEQRAQQLSRVLKDANIRRIYVTEVRRTQQTAAPLAEVLQITPTVIPQKDTDALLKQLRDTHDDETVLVVGHTNTVPLIVDRLGGGHVPPFTDNEYDRLIILVSGGGGNAHVVTLRYGDEAR
jgi:broad specificity phosphatase PhoE